MFGLIAAYGSATESESDTTDDEEEKKMETKLSLPKPFELPSPDLNSQNEKTIEKSVFINPYVAADNAKTALLEKHVKMISTDVISVNGKKVCWNNIKKKCRFGHRCKYAHVSDLQLPEGSTAQISNEKLFRKTPSVDETNTQLPTKKGTKRPGLTQGLIPGKKSMKMYNKQKNIK